MAGTGDVIALGFGPWSDIDVVPTFGFGVGEAAAFHVVTISGMSLARHANGLRADSTRTILASIVPGDESVEYVFEETEVS